MMAGLSHIDGGGSFTANLRRNPGSSSFRGQTPVMAVATTPSPSRSYWLSIESDVRSFLNDAIPVKSPEVVFEPMRHLTFAAPTTTASSLCVAACELVGGERSQAIAAAGAVHLMHAALYTHEHLELSDRRPQLSDRKIRIQHKYGPNIELLTGDGIVPFGVEILAGSTAHNSHDRILEVIREITRSVGSQGMIDGQYRKLSIEESGKTDPEEIEYVVKKRDGELHACGAACGAILGGAAGNDIEKLRKFGMFVGMVKGMIAENHPGLETRIGELKRLAMKEIEGFAAAKAELISSLV